MKLKKFGLLPNNQKWFIIKEAKGFANSFIKGLYLNFWTKFLLKDFYSRERNKGHLEFFINIWDTSLFHLLSFDVDKDNIDIEKFSKRPYNLRTDNYFPGHN